MINKGCNVGIDADVLIIYVHVLSLENLIKGNWHLSVGWEEEEEEGIQGKGGEEELEWFSQCYAEFCRGRMYLIR